MFPISKARSSARNLRTTAFAAITALGLAACSESPLSPLGGESFDRSPLMSSGSSGENSGTSGRGQEAGSRTFTVWPGFGVFQRFGDHVLMMPANVVCDPASSGYGPSFWDQPCEVLQRPIDVTATWTTVNGRPAISFSPDLRFAPSNDESRWVKLSLKDTKGIDPSQYYTVLWLDKATGVKVDEAATDPTLKAFANQSGNLVTRRLKHFSDWELWSGFGSYNVTSGAGAEIGLWEGW